MSNTAAFKEYERKATLVGSRTVSTHGGGTSEVRCYRMYMEYSGDFNPRESDCISTLSLWRRERGFEIALNCDHQQKRDLETEYRLLVFDEDSDEEVYSGTPTHDPSLVVVTGREHSGHVEWNVFEPSGTFDDDFRDRWRLDYLGLAWMRSDEGRSMPRDKQLENLKAELNIYGRWLVGDVSEAVVLDETGIEYYTSCGLYYGISADEDEAMDKELLEALDSAASKVASYRLMEDEEDVVEALLRLTRGLSEEDSAKKAMSYLERARDLEKMMQTSSAKEV